MTTPSRLSKKKRIEYGIDRRIHPSDREKIERTRRGTIADKFRDGLELFDFGCGLMRDGIRLQHSDADEDQVRLIMTERFAIARRLEDAE